MKVFFDKENLINYLKHCNDTEKGRDTLRMLKKQLSVHLNFKIDLLNQDEIILLSEFQTGVDDEFKLTHGSDKVARPLKRDSFPSCGDLYFLNDIDINKIKDQHFILIGSVNDEIECLSKLIINSDYSFHLEKLIGDHIKHDNHLDILNQPFSTILIIDRYMFKGPEIGGNLGLFEYNLEKILKKIFLNKRGPSRVIFVYQVKVNVKREHVLYDEGPDLDKLSIKIKKIVPKHCPTPEVFFIGVPDGSIADEHDRFLISNYLRIKSGDSFVYFTSSGEIRTDSKTVDFYSLAYRNHRYTTKALLDKISNIINITLDKNPRFSKVPTGSIRDLIINFS